MKIQNTFYNKHQCVAIKLLWEWKGLLIFAKSQKSQLSSTVVFGLAFKKCNLIDVANVCSSYISKMIFQLKHIKSWKSILQIQFSFFFIVQMMK